jgi:hypothetical protein
MNLWWVSGPFFIIISCNAAIFICLIEVNEKMSLVLFILKTIENSLKINLKFQIQVLHDWNLPLIPLDKLNGASITRQILTVGD